MLDGDFAQMLRSAAAGHAYNPVDMQQLIDLTADVQRAMRLFQEGRTQESAAMYRELLRASPDHPDLLHYLGMAEYKLGNREGARALMQRSIALDGRRAAVHVNLGRVLLNDGDAAGALAHFRDALGRTPASIEARHMLGRALLADDQPEAATDALEEAVAADGGLELRAELARAYAACHRHPAALEAWRAVLARQPDDVAALAGASFALRAMNRSAEALDSLRRVTALQPAEPAGWTNLGALFEELGDFAAAEDAFRRALALRPNYPVAVAHLLALKKGVDEPDLAERGEKHLAAGEIVRPVRVQLLFALGRHYDAVGDCARAFAHYRSANDIVGEGRRYKPLGVEAHILRHIAAFTRELFVAKRAFGNPSDRPLFIVGMPRSGTTLTEQILSSHRAIAGAGELGYFNHMAYELGSRVDRGDDLSSFATGLTAQDLESVASGFLAQLDSVSRDARRVTDKMPTNFQHLGLIALAFPNARIVHCRRDPRDNLLSCYVENFQEDQRYTTRLESLAHFHGQYRRLMRHWHAVLPLRILDVQYEELVADLPAQTRRLIDFCGLDWDENCLSFHRSARAVNTPSKWQVRQPIYSSSVGRWRRYETFIAPLLAALAEGNES